MLTLNDRTVTHGEAVEAVIEQHDVRRHPYHQQQLEVGTFLYPLGTECTIAHQLEKRRLALISAPTSRAKRTGSTMVCAYPL